MEPVIVVWMDAWTEDCDQVRNEIDHNPLETHSIGFLVRADEVGVTIAMDSYPSSSEDIRNVMFIPRGMIRKVIYLKE